MGEGESRIRIPEGRCSLCNDLFSKRAMSGHLERCREKNAPEVTGRAKPRREKVFHLVVEGYGLPEYWMHLEAPASATLRELDSVLRETWLECCGHMSAFTIGERRYSVSPLEEYGEEDMDFPLEEVLRPGMKFYHEYDFGTTTTLALKVVSEKEREIMSRAIQFLARNKAPVIPCGCCGKPATRACCCCTPDITAFVCDECAPQHECGEEMLLPVVNSPRTGMCAYGT